MSTPESETQSPTFPVLPLRDIVVLPHMIVPLFVGRAKSVKALEAVMKDDRQILLASQRDAAQAEPDATHPLATMTGSNIARIRITNQNTNPRTICSVQAVFRKTRSLPRGLWMTAGRRPISKNKPMAT